MSYPGEKRNSKQPSSYKPQAQARPFVYTSPHDFQAPTDSVPSTHPTPQAVSSFNSNYVPPTASSYNPNYVTPSTPYSTSQNQQAPHSTSQYQQASYSTYEKRAFNPKAYASTVYKPDFLNSSTLPPSVRPAPPPLSQLRRWFDYYDRNRDGTFDKEELVFAMMQTMGASKSGEASIRDSVVNVFTVFDDNGDGSIDRNEFCARAGLGESLIAMLKTKTQPASTESLTHWHCTKCSYKNYPSKLECAMCGSPAEGKDTKISSTSTATTTTKTKTFHVRIPSGMLAGQAIKVRVHGKVIETKIPEYSRWIHQGIGNPMFEIKVPVDPEPATTGSIVSPAKVKQKFKVPFENFRGRSYRPPLLQCKKMVIPQFLNPIHVSGRRRALIIGINYEGSRAALRGCINDAKHMKNLLLRQGFPNDSSHMVLLTDDQRGAHSPTGINIMKGAQWLTHDLQEGDVLHFHFSGHGAQVPDTTHQEADGLNETILPLDYKKKQITDDELWGSLVYNLPSGVRLTALMDCCHSGTGLDLPFEHDITDTTSRPWVEEINPAHSAGDVVLFSGCDDDETAADVVTNKGAAGAMTNAFMKAFEETSHPTYPEFLAEIQRNLKKKGYSQRPQLTSSQAFNINARVFSLVDGIEPNRNRIVGRIKRKRIKMAKHGKSRGLDLDELLFGAGAAVVTAGVLGGVMDMFM